MEPYSVLAHNTATEAKNKIHDDVVARQLGFRGGLVPGVDVYAYLVHPPVVAWGLDWLQRGTMSARFHQPVYDGRRVDVIAVDDGTLELRDDEGTLCAVAEVSLPDEPAPLPDPGDWPEAEPAAEPPSGSPESLAPGTALAIAPHRFHADRAHAYLVEVRETATIFSDESVAHPGWILRDANYVLSANVRLGPWIHVESTVQHHDVVRDGDDVAARAVVTMEWERKGHRFVELSVLHLAGDRPVATTLHSAIYRPRGV